MRIFPGPIRPARIGVSSIAMTPLSRIDRNRAFRIGASKDADPGIQFAGL